MKSLIFVSAFLALINVSSLKAQRTSETSGSPITIGETLKIKSKILGEERKIYVYVPPSYAKSKQRYPVIYTTDGESTFLPAASAVRFMTSASELPQMPEALVVSIPSTDRMRDMPIPQEYNMGRGEENFLAFFADELIPLIERKYRTQPLRVYIGHSQGGTFAHYSLTARPTVFQWYISLDGPLFGFEKLRPIIDKARVMITKDPNFRGRLVTVEKNFGWQKEWDSLIAAAPKSFYGAQVNITGETHETMVYKGIYEGLKHLFNDYAPDSNDARLADLEAKYKTLSELYGYPVDIPRSVLLSSANRNALQQNGIEAIKLVQRTTALYGESPATKEIMAAAEEAVKNGGPDPKVAEILSSPKPTAEQMKPFLGTWAGRMNVPEGAPLDVVVTFKLEDNEIRASETVSAAGVSPFSVHITFIRVLDNKTLQWGGPNGRIGLNIATAKLIDENTLKGTEGSLGVRRDPKRTLPPDPSFIYIRKPAGKE